MKHCAWCDSEFVACKGQLYCSTDCKRLSSEESIARRKEAARIKRRIKSRPRCSECKMPLSIYGHGNVCSSCIPQNVFAKAIKQIRGNI